MISVKTRRAMFLTLLVLLAGLGVALQGCGKQGSFSIPTAPIGTGVGTPGLVSDYSITLTSDKLSAKSGDKIKYTATVYYAASGARGPARLNVTFYFAFASGGAGAFTGFATTDASGVATFEVTVPQLAICDILTALAEVVSTNGELNTSITTSSVSIVGKDLALSPSSAEIACVNGAPAGSRSFGISGGCPPYTASISTPGFGSVALSGSTVTYTPPAACPASDTKVTLTVSDSQGNSKSAEITVKAIGATGTLTVTPSTATVGSGGTQVFVVSGGTAPYTFFPSGGTVVGSPGPGPFTYTAGAVPGTYTQIVTDSSVPTRTGTATVTIP